MVERALTFKEYAQLFETQFNEFYDLAFGKPYTAQRLYSCTATIIDYGNVILLQSYSTVVAIYHKDYELMLVKGRYSATTDQHVAKFSRWLREQGFNKAKVMFDYIRSTRSIGYNYRTTAEYKCYKSGCYIIRYDGTTAVKEPLTEFNAF